AAHLLLGAGRDLDHRRRDLAAARGQLLAHRAEVARAVADLARFADYRADDAPEATAHVVHRATEPLDLGRHRRTELERTQVAGAELLGRADKPAQRTVDRANGTERGHGTDEQRREEQSPE